MTEGIVMVPGVGVDVVMVRKVKRLLDSHPAALHEIFTDIEIAYCSARRRPDEHLAARFAAKEAVLKVLGTGFGAGMRWTDIEVVNDNLGTPRVRLHGETERTARRVGAGDISVSISHSDGVVIAVATCGALHEAA